MPSNFVPCAATANWLYDSSDVIIGVLYCFAIFVAYWNSACPLPALPPKKLKRVCSDCIFNIDWIKSSTRWRRAETAFPIRLKIGVNGAIIGLIAVRKVPIGAKIDPKDTTKDIILAWNSSLSSGFTACSASLLNWNPTASQKSLKTALGTTTPRFMRSIILLKICAGFSVPIALSTSLLMSAPTSFHLPIVSWKPLIKACPIFIPSAVYALWNADIPNNKAVIAIFIWAGFMRIPKTAAMFLIPDVLINVPAVRVVKSIAWSTSPEA